MLTTTTLNCKLLYIHAYTLLIDENADSCGGLNANYLESSPACTLLSTQADANPWDNDDNLAIIILAPVIFVISGTLIAVIVLLVLIITVQ